jgi:hypothetical protein|tara:strand:- start:90 stop:269 length:180 start_codon:yes stop_codon:yes gene_type:complete
MWILVWLQLISGNTLDHFHVGTYGSEENCQAELKIASVLVTASNMKLTCLNVTISGKTR